MWPRSKCMRTCQCFWNQVTQKSWIYSHHKCNSEPYIKNLLEGIVTGLRDTNRVIPSTALEWPEPSIKGWCGTAKCQQGVLRVGPGVKPENTHTWWLLIQLQKRSSELKAVLETSPSEMQQTLATKPAGLPGVGWERLRDGQDLLLAPQASKFQQVIRPQLPTCLLTCTFLKKLL